MMIYHGLKGGLKKKKQMEIIIKMLIKTWCSLSRGSGDKEGLDTGCERVNRVLEYVSGVRFHVVAFAKRFH